MGDQDDLMHGTASVHIDAPPEKVWALVSDVTRMGEWSSEVHEAAWTEGATGPAAGARFRGRNERGWDEYTVTASEPGTEFSFVVGTPEEPLMLWRYQLTPIAGGTDVTETWESVRSGFFHKLHSDAKRTRALDMGIADTLHNLKQLAEST